MKAIHLFLLLFLSALGVSAQSPANPPAVTPNAAAAAAVVVVQKEWYMEVNNPAFNKSPFGPIEELQQINQARKAIQRQNEIRARRGLPPLRTPVRMPQTETENQESPNVYTYKIKVKNNTEKTIQTLIWEYVFFEPGTEREVGRLQFVNQVKIAPGKTRDLAVSSLSPPSDTINVKQTGKKLRDQYSGQVVIQSVEYADGSVWQAAEEPPK